MMIGNNVLGILFANVHDERVRELTEHRTLASVPVGGRYRLIDFPLSNMVNAGINKVGVITGNNYQSLMDHLGSGKSWDLSRKREGLYILPPFGADGTQLPNRIGSLASVTRFLRNSKEEYVLISDCDFLCNIDYSAVFAAHIEKKADITMIYKYGKVPSYSTNANVLTTSPDGRVLGKMAHVERIGPGLYKNVPGRYDMGLFRSAVAYLGGR